MVGTEWLITAASLVAAIIIIFIAWKLLKLAAKYLVTLILNTIGGLLLILVANVLFSMGIPYDIPTLLISAICGVPGAACIIILKLMGLVL
ncbi:MAG TPA: pro-sigmaK processing inhibitor BofA family protein [Methanocella sp.]|uniref:pro-sigmaK processing inhibitor BofA family protein n=1 Tax=Methanocella sp. TaxID=2052833 RepID=UPI002B6500BF|nr:pro-sigmaK processing inhibitor BofA family protein [Methanocella sp.]HTY91781.1 pro-sigmaK processing inhibitor BofA family protein [Methanocella sp.]